MFISKQIQIIQDQIMENGATEASLRMLQDLAVTKYADNYVLPRYMVTLKREQHGDVTAFLTQSQVSEVTQLLGMGYNPMKVGSDLMKEMEANSADNGSGVSLLVKYWDRVEIKKMEKSLISYTKEVDKAPE